MILLISQIITVMLSLIFVNEQDLSALTVNIGVDVFPTWNVSNVPACLLNLLQACTHSNTR